jgi:hypothetical protein
MCVHASCMVTHNYSAPVTTIHLSHGHGTERYQSFRIPMMCRVMQLATESSNETYSVIHLLCIYVHVQKES